MLLQGEAEKFPHLSAVSVTVDTACHETVQLCRNALVR
jgi:hypothetical protein